MPSKSNPALGSVPTPRIASRSSPASVTCAATSFGSRSTSSSPPAPSPPRARSAASSSTGSATVRHRARASRSSLPPTRCSAGRPVPIPPAASSSAISLPARTRCAAGSTSMRIARSIRVNCSTRPRSGSTRPLPPSSMRSRTTRSARASRRSNRSIPRPCASSSIVASMSPGHRTRRRSRSCAPTRRSCRWACLCRPRSSTRSPRRRERPLTRLLLLLIPLRP